ncbi:hypothetical protein [Amycolatopsis sp. NPDC021455]|uniref:hypothetical protein n=1 Tax=Amycolatopsis sp. NPDC021455 TaxID=3154901 RepID=UPI0033D4058D
MSEEARRQQAWAAVCTRWRRIAGDANWFALRDRFDELVAATRGGEDTLAGWHALEADIARLTAAELDQTIRHGELADETPAWFAGSATTYGCPLGRCDRAVRAAPGSPPKCLLFGVPMAEPR